MMGYPTQFGQVECLKLIASQNFTEKRVGYLGLSQLLNESNEVLMMVTNRIQIDLANSNQQIVSMALTALGNVGTAEMGRDLSKDLLRLLMTANSFNKKKAVMAAVRVITKCPEFAEDYYEVIPTLLQDRSHGVVMAAVRLVRQIIIAEPSSIERFRPSTTDLVRVLKNLLLSGYSPEHDISGVTDPFLQVEILGLLRDFGRKDVATSDVMNDALAQVATNTESSKTAGNSVLYECVKTIIEIEASSGLRVLATNIMGRFLLNRDNNIRYVALKTLQQMVGINASAVQRHKNTILECLKDADPVIRKKALELASSIANPENVVSLMKELLNYLLVAENDLKPTFVTKLFNVVEHFAPSKTWQVETIVKILSLAGNFVSDEILSATAQLICSSPDVQPYAVHKLYSAFKDNMAQTGLVMLAVWCIGEFAPALTGNSAEAEGEVFVPVSANQVLDTLEALTKRTLSQSISEYLLTAYIKLTIRMPEVKARLTLLIDKHTSQLSLELQQRACEYLKLLDSPISGKLNYILGSIPALKRDVQANMPLMSEVFSQAPVEKPKPVENTPVANSLLELDLIFDTIPSGPSQPSTGPSIETALADIFGPSTPVLNVFDNPPQPRQDPISMPVQMDPYMQPISAPQVPQKLEVVGYEDTEISIKHRCTKLEDPSLTQIDTSVVNLSGFPISNFRLQVAVQKYMKLQLSPASGSSIAPGNSITQQIKVTNSQQGSKGIVLRLKIDYQIGGESRSKVATVSSFPVNY
mmetsp:Transcript_27506/g.49546  ORF Transcript_27506/g.49546 Transcript_27506/m.49546 type:complete len:756 (-) Transcript_27506:1901-4168(-)